MKLECCNCDTLESNTTTTKTRALIIGRVQTLIQFDIQAPAKWIIDGRFFTRPARGAPLFIASGRNPPSINAEKMLACGKTI
jgi:hypothetical protein